jgi:hypothetical protein
VEDRAPFVTPVKDRGIAGLFSDLAREAGRLIQQEIALARAELVDRAARMSSGAALVAIGAGLAFAALLALAAAAILAIALVLPAWAAALIVGGVLLAAALAFILKGRGDLAAKNLVPKRTIKTLREDAAWAREQMR